MNMRRFLAVFGCAWLAALSAGCGGSPPADPAAVVATVGPHGGRAVSLPDKKGLVEVVVEPAKGSTKANRQVVLAVYLLGPDGKSALSPAPSQVAVSVVTPQDTTAKPVSLRAEDAAKPGTSVGLRYVSDPGDFDYDELRGDVSITIEGREVKARFARS
jgi:hypothetical protein